MHERRRRERGRIHRKKRQIGRIQEKKRESGGMHEKKKSQRQWEGRVDEKKMRGRKTRS